MIIENFNSDKSQSEKLFFVFQLHVMHVYQVHSKNNYLDIFFKYLSFKNVSKIAALIYETSLQQ